MRVLIVTSHRGIVGGVERYLQLLIPGLRDQHHRVSLLHEYPYWGEERIDDAQQIPTWCPAEIGIEAALRAVNEWQPDIVYSHGVDNPELERAFVEKYPVVQYVHTYRGTCVSGRKCHTLPRVEPCKRRFGKGCLALFYPRGCGGLNPLTMLRDYRVEVERQVLFPKYRAMLVASQHMRRELEQHGAPNVRLLKLPSGCLPTMAPPKPKLPQGRLLFMGRLGRVKGVDHLIRAIPEAEKILARSLTVCIAGDGQGRSTLEKLAKQLRVNAEFTGWLNNRQKTTLMHQSDLLVVPSLWPEPFGLVGVEAGCVGLPAVGYDVGGIPDWLIPGESGELAPGDPPSVSGLAEAIVRALANPEHYNQLCAGAWKMAKQFTLEDHLSELESILRAATLPSPLPPNAFEIRQPEMR